MKGLTTLVSDTKKYSTWVVLGELQTWTWARQNLMLIPEIFLCEEGIFFSFFFLSVTGRKDNIARLPLKGVKDGCGAELLPSGLFLTKRSFFISPLEL